MKPPRTCKLIRHSLMYNRREKGVDRLFCREWRPPAGRAGGAVEFSGHVGEDGEFHHASVLVDACDFSGSFQAGSRLKEDDVPLRETVSHARSNSNNVRGPRRPRANGVEPRHHSSDGDEPKRPTQNSLNRYTMFHLFSRTITGPRLRCLPATPPSSYAVSSQLAKCQELSGEAIRPHTL